MNNLNFKIRTAALLIGAFLNFALPAAAQDVKDDSPIKVNTVFFNIPVIVSDKNGRNILGLTKENFTIRQDGDKQKIEYFANLEAPMNVAVIIDTSGSTIPFLGDIKHTAKAFLKTLAPADKAMIVSFDGEYQVLSELTANQKSLEKAINKAVLIESKGSSMYDAIYDVVKNKLGAVEGRKAVIILTDGLEGSAKISSGQLLLMLAESDTIMYPIQYKTKNYLLLPESSPNSANENDAIRRQIKEKIAFSSFYLQAMADATAGQVYVDDSNDFKEAFRKIADELKKHYLIGFYPQNADDGKAHQVIIEANSPDIIIKTKRNIRIDAAK